MRGDKVNIGVVGAGSFADLWYLPILKKHPFVKIQAICSVSGASAKKLAEKYDIQSRYVSYKDMFDSEKLDGICIVTPNDSHFPIAVDASKRGIHVICEKPLAIDQYEASSMVESARNNQIVHGINFTYRENPAVKVLKSYLDDGIIGKIYEGRFQYTGGYGLSGSPGWRGTKSKGGVGGVLADLGSHLIDLVQYVLSERISSVQSSISFLHDGRLKSIHEMEIHDQSADSVFFNASFSSGAHGSFYTSWISDQGNRNQTIELSFFGSKGAIEFLSSELGVQLRYAPRGEIWKDIHVETAAKWNNLADSSEERFRPWRLTDQNIIWKWIDLIIEKQKTGRCGLTSIPTFEGGYSVQKVIDAVIQSSYKRKEILIDY